MPWAQRFGLKWAGARFPCPPQGFDVEMSDNSNDGSKPTERPLRFRQILILAALVFGFAFAIRIAGGEPLPRDLQDFIARYFLG